MTVFTCHSVHSPSIGSARWKASADTGRRKGGREGLAGASQVGRRKPRTLILGAEYDSGVMPCVLRERRTQQLAYRGVDAGVKSSANTSEKDE